MQELKQIQDQIGAIAPKVHKLAKQLVFNDLDPEDVAQDVFLKLLSKSTKSIPSNITFSWLRTVVRNAVYDAYELQCSQSRYLDRNTVIDVTGTVCESEADYSHNTPESLRTKAIDCEPDLLPRIKKVLASLSKPHRQVLLLHLQGYSCEEIAELTCANTGTVKSRLYHARKRAQSKLTAFR